MDGPRDDAEYELFPEDLERLTPHIEAAINRVPAFGEVGVKQVYNGAIPYTPDGSPIIGPAWGLRNFWLNEGHSFGITAAGGAGWQLAEWIVEGEPTIDMLGVEPRRFGAYATKAYLRKKNEEAYANVFTIHYPDEERPAGAAAAHGAVLRPDEGAGRGVRPEVRLGAAELVRARGHAAGGPLVVPALELVRARRRGVPNVAAERRPAGHDRVRQGAVSGPGAEAFLDRLVANRLPKAIGRVQPVPRAEQPGRGALRVHDHARGRGQLLSGLGRRVAAPRPRLAPRSTCRMTARSSSRTSPARSACWWSPARRRASCWQRVSDADLSNAAFPWLTGREIMVGLAPTRALRVNFVGELGWELHHGLEYQNHIFDALMAAGADLGLKPFGIRAMDSMRIEKSYRLIGTELSIEYAAYESGLERFVHPNKGDFIGRDALVRWRERGFRTGSSRWRCTTSPTPMRSATTRSMRTAGWSGARPAATTAFALKSRWRWPWSVPSTPSRHRARDDHPRQQAPRHRHPRKPLRSGQPAPESLIAYGTTSHYRNQKA